MIADYHGARKAAGSFSRRGYVATTIRPISRTIPPGSFPDCMNPCPRCRSNHKSMLEALVGAVRLDLSPKAESGATMMLGISRNCSRRSSACARKAIVSRACIIDEVIVCLTRGDLRPGRKRPTDAG